jgi:hypothetical protein
MKHSSIVHGGGMRRGVILGGIPPLQRQPICSGTATFAVSPPRVDQRHLGFVEAYQHR